MSETRNTTVAQYAEAHGVDEETIRQQIRKGVIARPIQGLIDVAQADASWGRIRRARITVQSDDQGRRSAEAKIMDALARLRLSKHRLDAARERLVSRSDAIAGAGADVDYFITALEQIPEQRAAACAQALGIEPAVARKVLDRFIALALAELGDLKSDAVRMAEAA